MATKSSRTILPSPLISDSYNSYCACQEPQDTAGHSHWARSLVTNASAATCNLACGSAILLFRVLANLSCITGTLRGMRASFGIRLHSVSLRVTVLDVLVVAAVIPTWTFLFPLLLSTILKWFVTRTNVAVQSLHCSAEGIRESLVTALLA